MGHLSFNSVGDFQEGIGTHGREAMGDVLNSTTIRLQMQISEIVG